MESFFTIFSSALAIFLCLDARVAAISCYASDNGPTTGCNFCQITSTLSGASATIVQTCASTCTPTMSVTQQIFCCTTDFCNAPTSPPPAGGSGPPGSGPPGTGPPNGLRCYSDLSGNSGNTANNCGYCMKTSLNVVGVKSVTQTCVPSCMPMNVVGQVVACCQTDLCNRSTLKIPSGFLISLAAVIGMIFNRALQSL